MIAIAASGAVLTTPDLDSWDGAVLVPGERIELPTNGLQNRCSTAELTRPRQDRWYLLPIRNVCKSLGRPSQGRPKEMSPKEEAPAAMRAGACLSGRFGLFSATRAVAGSSHCTRRPACA
jgi:hypothetical protein